jgi:hypothetical protein
MELDQVTKQKAVWLPAMAADITTSCARACYCYLTAIPIYPIPELSPANRAQSFTA